MVDQAANETVELAVEIVAVEDGRLTADVAVTNLVALHDALQQVAVEDRTMEPDLCAAASDPVEAPADHRHVGEANPDRDASVVLFRRIFGERQSPDAAVYAGA